MAETFKAGKHTFDLRLTLGAVRFIENSDFSALTETPVTFMKGVEQNLLMELYSDIGLRCAVIYAILIKTKQFEGTEDEFTDLMDGPALESSRDALWEAIGNFFPKLKEGLLNCKELMEKMDQAMTNEIQEKKDLLVEMGIQHLKQEGNKMLKKFGELSGDKQESLATPDPK